MAKVVEVRVERGSRDEVPRRVTGPDGAMDVPADWVHVPPGDPLVTRRIKASGPAWVVTQEVGNKVFARGLFAPGELVDRVRRAAERERQSPEHARRLEAGRARREREQEDYVRQFHREVVAFLAFAPVHAELAHRLAERVTAHATPVGSGTVARTRRIEVAERAEAAVIAWLRHQTTAYDSMSIARVKGRRREVRRALAQVSRGLLERYRRGLPVAEGCPLAAALSRVPEEKRAPEPRKLPRTKPAPAPAQARETQAAEPVRGRPEPARLMARPVVLAAAGVGALARRAAEAKAEPAEPPLGGPTGPAEASAARLPVGEPAGLARPSETLASARGSGDDGDDRRQRMEAVRARLTARTRTSGAGRRGRGESA